MMRLLDGPMGTELGRRGVSLASAEWSARALADAPEVVAAIHADYAAAGATVHTATTFRTRRLHLGSAWEEQARFAVTLARRALPEHHQLAGSIAPLSDCYRPDLSPADTAAHGELPRVLAAAGCDLLLCETFPHAGEAAAAVRHSVRTGLPTWVAFTAGPRGHLLDPETMSEAAREAVGAGASAVLVNCTPARDTRRFLEAIARAKLGVEIGAYANAAVAANIDGVEATSDPGPSEYARLALGWRDAGATIIGGCCGTTPAHVAALAQALG